jgi:hypothetical protein
MSTPSEQSASQPGSSTPEVVTDINEKLDESPTNPSDNKDLSDNEKTLLQKVSEIGEDAISKLKGAFAEIDKEELRKSINKDSIQRSVASTLDGFNDKIQSLLAPKNESDTEPAATPAPATEDKL